MNQMNHLETLKAQATMSEYSEKETASRAHEHLKGKSNMPIARRTYRTIRTFWYRFGALRKQTYFGYGRTYKVYWYGLPTGMGTGVPLERKRTYVQASNGNFVTRTLIRGSDISLVGQDSYKSTINRQWCNGRL